MPPIIKNNNNDDNDESIAVSSGTADGVVIESADAESADD